MVDFYRIVLSCLGAKFKSVDSYLRITTALLRSKIFIKSDIFVFLLIQNMNASVNVLEAILTALRQYFITVNNLQRLPIL